MSMLWRRFRRWLLTSKNECHRCGQVARWRASTTGACLPCMDAEDRPRIERLIRERREIRRQIEELEVFLSKVQALRESLEREPKRLMEPL